MMKTQYSILFVLPIHIALGMLYRFNSIFVIEDNNHHHPVNALIGDKSFIAVYGEEPGADVPEQVRIQTHLQYVYPPERLHIAFEVLRVQIPNVVVSGRHNMLERMAKPLVGIDVLLFADCKK